MKNISIALNAILVLVILYLLFGNTKKQTTETKEKVVSKVDTIIIRDTIPCKEISMLYINTDSLYNNYKMIDTYRKKLANEQKKLEAELESKQKQLESELLVYREEQQYMTEEELRLKEEEFKQKYDNLYILQQDLSQKFNDSGVQTNDKIQKKIKEFLTRFCEEKGCNYIIGYGMLNPILYADKDLDVTNEVVSRLNSEYSKK